MIKPDLANFYMETAKNASKLSKAIKLKVGCVVVKNDNIISFSWNGTPSGWDNSCETIVGGELKTKPETIHAEQNALYKLAKHGISANGATIFITHNPCANCAKGIIQSGITHVYYTDEYRDSTGLEILQKSGIIVTKLEN